MNLLMGLTKLEEQYDGNVEVRNIVSIPLSILKDRNYGMLEASIIYLREEKRLKYKEIATLLNRDVRTITTSYYNATKKRKNRDIY